MRTRSPSSKKVAVEDEIEALRTVLEKAGVEFTNGKRRGVRIR
jgi:hypothetical protein